MTSREFGKRALIGGGVGGIAAIAYGSIQLASADRALVRSTCWTWRHLPFAPDWVWPYYSMFLLVGLPWFLVARWRDVRAFAMSVLATAAIGWVFFLVVPTACLRPVAAAQPVYYRVLVALDQPDNCLPCLHSAFAVLAAIVLAIGAPAFQRALARLALFAWVMVICISIVALRQHTDVDMLVGALLGLAAGILYWYSTRPAPDEAAAFAVRG